ncbi:MAG: hypothetical protein K8S98_00655 [Planctomycetes bacterium]|nr:hypothetical protein [Planctomycetota bacterium]
MDGRSLDDDEREALESIPDSLYELAGFALGHAAWILSELESGVLLAPFGMTHASENRQLVPFEAETQEQAIAGGKAWFAEHGHEFDAWVFAREGRLTGADSRVDALTVEARARGMAESVYFVQRFKPRASGAFKVFGGPIVFWGTKWLSDEAATALFAKLHVGLRSHAEAAQRWPEWSS